MARIPLPYLPGGAYSSFLRVAYRRPAERLTGSPGSIQTRTHTLLDHSALELGENAAHLEHGFAGRDSSVDALLVQVQTNTFGVNLAQESDRVLK